jgi:penicillin-binding protein 1C
MTGPGADLANRTGASPLATAAGGNARRSLPGELRPANRRRWRVLAFAVAFLVLSGAIASLAAWGTLRVMTEQMGPLPLGSSNALSVTVVDRENRLLRAFTTGEGRWRLPLEPDDVDPRYFDILFAFEDKRFYEHSGIDPYAFLRAGFQLAWNGRIISGGSTLTMQVARLLTGRHERTASGKLRQIVRAIQLEEQLSKKEILRLYLRLAPFGGNLEGVRAASLSYFGKEPRHLSTGEAALLVALPQSPESRRPDRDPAAARRARNRVLDRSVSAGVLGAAEAERAKSEAIPTARLEFPKLAPHLSERVVANRPGKAVHRLTLDRTVQSAFEQLAREQAKLAGSKVSAAILAVDHASGEVIAHVGSAGFLDYDRFGAIDMVEAVRSPGSTLKPLIYGLAFEAGLAHPETLIEDRPVRFGTYRPENFDDDFHGTVTIREALGTSLNIPAVKVLAAVGPGKLVGRLKRAGIDTALPSGVKPSLAIALGGIGIKLSELTAMYAGLARGGDPVALTWRKAATARSQNLRASSRSQSARLRLLSPVAAWYVTDILKDAPPPPNARRGKIAYKTGTSYGYRDAWAAGYDGKYTIAVWIGRPDAVSTPGLMGRLAAAPILFDAFARLSQSRAALAKAPAGAIKTTGANLPPPLKRFRDGPGDMAQGPYLDPPVLIAFPPDRAELEFEDLDDTPLMLKAEGGVLPLTWMVDGAPIGSDPHSRQFAWLNKERGFIKLSVIDANGRVDRVTVRLK